MVDNGSKKDETLFLRDHYPFVKTIRSNCNLGFAGGNNLGYSFSSGRYLFFLNNDTIIQDDSLHFLVEILKENPKTGGVSPKIMFHDERSNIQFAGYTELSSITIRNKNIGYDEKDSAQYDASASTAYLHGAAMMVKREVIERIGLMPECYFLYYEEMDWSAQMKQAGYDLVFEPRARVYHKESSSAGKESPLKIYYLTRNRMLYAWRNRRGIIRLLSIAYLALVVNSKNLIIFTTSLKFHLAKASLRGCLDFFRMKPLKNKWK